MSRMRRARWLVAIIIAQVVLVGAYWFVEERREVERKSEHGQTLGTDPPREVDTPMPALRVRRSDGSNEVLTLGECTTVVHFWATWCAPCRKELPRLLELADRHGVEVVAVALDKGWRDVRSFMGEMDMTHVVLADREQVAQSFGVRHLPVTFIAQPDGRTTLRFDGARDWGNDAFLKRYLQDFDSR